MTEDAEYEERRKGRGYAIAILVPLPVLYVLGVGPVSHLYDQSPPAMQTALETAYVPLEIFTEFAGVENWFSDVMQPYVDLWTS